MINKFILHSKTPSFGEMTCIICSIDVNEKHDKSAISSFHWQVLKCRMLIFSTSKLIVCPNATNNTDLIIIFKRDSMDTRKLRVFIDKFNIKVILSMAVTAKLFEACFKYTLSAKLSPFWNLLENNLYVAGREFLTDQQPLDALLLNINVSNEVITMEVKCLKARLGRLRIEDFNILPRKLDYFFNIPDASLSEMSLMDQWIHVLPSMKKGRIISINKKIPKTSPFNLYKDLKRHWKNIYGYRLPESDTDLIYYEVHFRPLGDNLYTYPSICLRPGPPLLTPPTQEHARKILDHFLTDLHNRMPSVLDYIMNFESPDKYLTKIPMSNILNAPKPDDSPEHKYQEANDDVSRNFHVHDNNDYESMITQTVNLTQHISLCTPTQKDSNENDKSDLPPRVKPVFKSKKFAQKTSVETDLRKEEAEENLNRMADMKKNISESLTSGNSEIIASPLTTTNNPIIPIFSNKMTKVSKSHAFITKPKAKSKQKADGKIKTPINKITVKDIELKKETAIPDKSKSNILSEMIDNNREISKQMNLSQISLIKPNDSQQNGHIFQNSQKGKRKIESDKSTASKKRKQEVDLSTIDIPKMAKTNLPALKKLNIQILVTWLRSVNIPGTSKMRKQELLDKVLETVQATN